MNTTKQTDWNKDNLNGRVRSIRETPYYAERRFGISATDNIFDNEKWRNILKRYDAKGNLSELHYYYSSGDLCIKWVYQYDEWGNLKGMTGYNPKKWINSYEFYRYDSNGNRIEENIYTAGNLPSISIYIYDDKGNRTEMNRYKADGRLSQKETYEYDNMGKLAELNCYNEKGSMLKKYEYKYNDKGRLTDWSELKLSGRMRQKLTCEYDDRGNLTELIEYKQFGKTIIKRTYKYKLDDRNNWIEKTECKNGKEEIITEREIIYYE